MKKIMENLIILVVIGLLFTGYVTAENQSGDLTVGPYILDSYNEAEIKTTKEGNKGDITTMPKIANKKKRYQKSFIKKEIVMAFPVEIMNTANDKYNYNCKQCAACHRCRTGSNRLPKR